MRAPISLLLSAATLLSSHSRQLPPTPIEAFWALVSADSMRATAAEQLIVEGWDGSTRSCGAVSRGTAFPPSTIRR